MYGRRLLFLHLSYLQYENLYKHVVELLLSLGFFQVKRISSMYKTRIFNEVKESDRFNQKGKIFFLLFY